MALVGSRVAGDVHALTIRAIVDRVRVRTWHVVHATSSTRPSTDDRVTWRTWQRSRHASVVGMVTRCTRVEGRQIP
jgi:hypothetical protein